MRRLYEENPTLTVCLEANHPQCNIGGDELGVARMRSCGAVKPLVCGSGSVKTEP